MKEKISKKITPVNLYVKQEEYFDKKNIKKGPMIRDLIDKDEDYKFILKEEPIFKVDFRIGRIKLIGLI